MLSFFHLLGKKSYPSQPAITRSVSSESAISRPGTLKSSNGTSTAPSPTPPTSHTDTASESANPAEEPKAHRRSSQRLQQAPPSIRSYNENVLSGSARRATRRKSGVSGSRTVSGKTVDDNVESEELGVQQNVEILDREWSLGAMPGDDLKPSLEMEKGPKTRKSTRLEVREYESGIVEKTTSVLGKRGRENLQAGMEKLQNWKEGKRASLRPRTVEPPILEEPMAKRARFADVSAPVSSDSPSKSERKIVRPTRTKTWLSQGLYVGQNRDFDPRLTETKNRLKHSSGRSSTSHQRSLLPLPMFAGDRMLKLERDFRLPFDVFSPLPPGQPKPEEWKKTRKNVFVGDAANVWKKSKSLESSKCVCTPESGCDEDCFNRLMFYECDSTNCNIGANHCTNRSFEGLRQRCKEGGRYNIGVEVVKTIDRGYGVRSNRCFESNQIIVEYTGEIITQDECDDRMNKRYKDSECYYLMDFDQQMISDATRGSIARFVNHSCEPNCRMIKWTVAGTPRMALFAGDGGIMTGEELTYDYNFNPYSVKNVQECRCGTPSCRGFLGPKPKEIKDALKPISTGKKRKFQEALENTIETVTKKRKIAVPSSVKNAFAAAKAQTSKTLTQAGILASSSARNEGLVRKVSTVSLREQRKRTAERMESQSKKSKPITYTRRRSLAGTHIQERTSTDNEPLSINDHFKSKASSVRKNVVRTVRRSSRGVPGRSEKSIRVIETELD